MAKKYEFDYDLIVIGSGAGGSAAANIAANEGKRVALVEADTFGGGSPNWSDVPTKALLHAANLYDEAVHGARFGLRSATISYNYPSIRSWKNLAVKRTGVSNNREYYEKQGINTFIGSAHFISPNEITVNRRHLSANNFLIATGSQWEIPKIVGLDKIKYLTPRTILEEIRPPKNLMIIGGGENSVEIAQLMATFGTKVYIVEKSDRLLPKYDREVGEIIARILTEQKGANILTQSKVVAIEKDGLSKRITVSRAGVEKNFRVDEVLIATKRLPNIDLGLENAGVNYSKNGIKVNNFLQTNIKHIYAAGSVIGKSFLTHSAILESRIVANNILKRNKTTPDYLATPEIIFTNPGIAVVGLSEEECIKQKIAINKAIAPLNIIIRSNTSDFRDGFVKVITDKKGVVLGGSIVCPHAGEMIHELVLAIKYGLTASQIADTPHAFLSWSEAIRVCAGKLS